MQPPLLSPGGAKESKGDPMRKCYYCGKVLTKEDKNHSIENCADYLLDENSRLKDEIDTLRNTVLNLIKSMLRLMNI